MNLNIERFGFEVPLEDRFIITIEKDNEMCRVLVEDKWVLENSKKIWDLESTKREFCRIEDVPETIEKLKNEYRKITDFSKEKSFNSKTRYN